MRRLAVLLIAISGLAACGDSHSSAAAVTVPVANAGAAVSIKNIAFTPRTVTIHPGQAVVWTFRDGDVPHNVTGDGYASATRTSGTFVHTFPAPGTYNYSCTIHTGMTGTVVVSS
ncbi:MAG TPA: plastocyanin/azurin family copper-binding protein [Acidimicrobiales bacterium]|jgi:plastocyanin